MFREYRKETQLTAPITPTQPVTLGLQNPAEEQGHGTEACHSAHAPPALSNLLTQDDGITKPARRMRAHDMVSQGYPRPTCQI